ncbi:MAG: 50S ribosomal protein L32 [Clostridia bacterium]|nr:50S ribosomal protein L32 [Clostridia bacterium]
MAVPKGKISKARGRKRRTHWKLDAPGIVKCPRCQQMKLSHRVCKHCGYYDGKQVVVMDDDKKKKKEKEA